MRPHHGNLACEECGYPLSGLSSLQPVCPECGGALDPRSRFGLHPAVPLWTLLARACWPTLAMTIGFCAVAWLGPPETVPVIIASWPVWGVAWVLITAGRPHWIASGYTQTHVLRPRRMLVRRLLTAGMFGLNMLIILAIVLASAVLF